jgi:carbamoyl-phosphate synthase large subunit
MLKTGACGLVGNGHLKFNNVELELINPSHERIFAIVEALKHGYSIEQIHNLSLIDKWFLYKINNIYELSKKIATINNTKCPFELLQKAKQLGFSDYQIAGLSGITETEIRRQRHKFGLYPYVKQIDTLAAEYPAKTNYLYLTYNSQEHDIEFGGKNQVIILGSGAYSIGSSVEFDWCCVNTAVTLRKLGYRTIIINYNPETVSTDYSESDKLYFEDLDLETVLEISRMENPLGVIISMGGQIPNNLAMKLHNSGVGIIGTSAVSIDNAEDRKKFSRLLDELDILQPEWTETESLEAAEFFADRVGYPVLVRPSYVLSGAAMGVASNSAELTRVLQSAAEVSEKYPVVVSKFIEKAKELDIDAVAREGEIVAWAVSEHVENAGVHSGDATLVHPPQRTYLETIRRIKQVTNKIAKALNINGPFNIQFIAKHNQISVIECNLRASRSLPFVSKIQKINFIDRATRVIMGHDVTFSDNSFFDLEYVGVKAPQFSFMRLDDADPTLGVEMASTGEVACLGDDFEEAFLKALLAVVYRFPIKSMFLSTGPVYAKAAFIDHIKKLISEGIKLYATKGTADFLSTHGIDTFVLKWPLEKESPNAIDYLSNGEIDMVINIPKNYHEDELTNDYLIRRQAVDHGIPLITNIQLAQRFVEAIFNKTSQDLSTKSWAEYKMNHHAYRESL